MLILKLQGLNIFQEWKAKSFSVYRVFQDCPIAREFENLLTQPMDIQPGDICKYYEDILLQAYKTNIKKNFLLQISQ